MKDFIIFEMNDEDLKRYYYDSPNRSVVIINYTIANYSVLIELRGVKDNNSKTDQIALLKDDKISNVIEKLKHSLNKKINFIDSDLHICVDLNINQIISIEKISYLGDIR